MNRALKKLAAPCALALLLVAIGGGAIVGAQSFADEVQRERRQIATQRAAAEQKLARVQHEATEIDLRVAQYQALERRGILAEETRLDWIEALDRAKATAGLQDVRYAFAAQQTLNDTGGVLTRSSLVTVQGKAGHEGHFMSFLRALPREMAPYVSFQACTLTRGSAPLTGEGLQTQCQVALLTLADPQHGRSGQ